MKNISISCTKIPGGQRALYICGTYGSLTCSSMCLSREMEDHVFSSHRPWKGAAHLAEEQGDQISDNFNQSTEMAVVVREHCLNG